MMQGAPHRATSLALGTMARGVPPRVTSLTSVTVEGVTLWIKVVFSMYFSVSGLVRSAGEEKKRCTWGGVEGHMSILWARGSVVSRPPKDYQRQMVEFC
jgi:hypothetical protein